MTQTNDLTRFDALVSSDLFRGWNTAGGSERAGSLLQLQTYMQANLTFSGFTTQRSAPAATGFNVQISGTGVNIWLILTPSAGYAAGTITLPAVAGLVDQQEVSVNTTQAVTTLTVDGNGATSVIGEPTTLAANDFFLLRYDLSTQNWYRVG